MAAVHLHEVDPGSGAWWRLRRGIPTASQFHNIVTPKKCEPSTSARPYMFRLIAERLLGETFTEKMLTPALEHGVTYEAAALEEFAKTHSLILRKIGFVSVDDDNGVPIVGATPDAMVMGSTEAVEIKCPHSPWIQIKYLLDGVDAEYKPQVQGQLWITGWPANNLYCYHPRMPPYHRRTERDDKYISTMESIIMEFVDTLDRETERARDMGVYVWAEENLPEGPLPF